MRNKPEQEQEQEQNDEYLTTTWKAEEGVDGNSHAPRSYEQQRNELNL